MHLPGRILRIDSGFQAAGASTFDYETIVKKNKNKTALTIDSPCECAHNDPDSIDARL